MPVCEICGEVVDRVYKCADCGLDFCIDCGDPEKKLCTLCMPYKAEKEERSEEEEWEEEEWQEEEEEEER